MGKAAENSQNPLNQFGEAGCDHRLKHCDELS